MKRISFNHSPKYTTKRELKLSKRILIHAKSQTKVINYATIIYIGFYKNFKINED